MSFEDLLRSTSLSSRQLAHDLAALYLAGSITSNLKRAASARLGGPPEAGAPSGHSVSPSLLPLELGLNPASRWLARGGRIEATEPAPLAMK